MAARAATAELRADLAKVIAGQGGTAAGPRASALQPVAHRPPTGKASAPPTEAVATQGKMSPQLLMIAIGLVIGISAVLVALFLKR